MQTFGQPTPKSLEEHGIRNVNAVYWNLHTPLLYEEAIRRREGRVAHLDRWSFAPDNIPGVRPTTSSSYKNR